MQEPRLALWAQGVRPSSEESDEVEAPQASAPAPRPSRPSLTTCPPRSPCIFLSFSRQISFYRLNTHSLCHIPRDTKVLT